MPPVEEVATLAVCHGDRSTLDQLSEQLADDRLKVLPAPTAPDALRLCRFNHPGMLILDLALPDMEAVDLIGQIRGADGVDGRIASNLPIIGLIGPGHGAIRSPRRHDLGADDYLQKPFSHPELNCEGIRAWAQSPRTLTSLSACGGRP